MEFQRLFLKRHFAGKPLVASQNVVCFLRLQCMQDLAIVQAMFLDSKTSNQCHNGRKNYHKSQDKVDVSPVVQTVFPVEITPTYLVQQISMGFSWSPPLIQDQSCNIQKVKHALKQNSQT